MENENLLPEEKKGCRRKSGGTKDQLVIDKTILKHCRKRRRNLAMAWIDYRKTYDFVPHCWILECSVLTCLALLITSEVFWRKAWRSGNFFWVRMGRIYGRLTSIEASYKEIACHHSSSLFLHDSFVSSFTKSKGFL